MISQAPTEQDDRLVAGGATLTSVLICALVIESSTRRLWLFNARRVVDATTVSRVRAKTRARIVRSPSGTTWQVRRVWVRGYGPRFGGRLRRSWKVDSSDFARQLPWDLPGVDGLDGAAALIGVIAALILAVFVLLPLLLFGVELIIVGAVIAAGTLARLFLGAPWIVVAERLDGLGVALAWQVAGLRRSSLVVEEIARDLDAGNEPAPEGAGRIPPPRPLA